MPDMEKVTKSMDRQKIVDILKYHISLAKNDGFDFVDLIVDEAEQILALLERWDEKVGPTHIKCRDGWWYACPECKTAISPFDRFCRMCSKPIDWMDISANLDQDTEQESR